MLPGAHDLGRAAWRSRDELEEAFGLQFRRGTHLITFDGKLHPRDRAGKFAAKLGGIKEGERAVLPGGTRVVRKASGYEVQHPHARGLIRAGYRTEHFTSAHEAAHSAVQGDLHNVGSVLGTPQYEHRIREAVAARGGSVKDEDKEVRRLTHGPDAAEHIQHFISHDVAVGQKGHVSHGVVVRRTGENSYEIDHRIGPGGTERGHTAQSAAARAAEVIQSGKREKQKSTLDAAARSLIVGHSRGSQATEHREKLDKMSGSGGSDVLDELYPALAGQTPLGHLPLPGMSSESGGLAEPATHGAIHHAAHGIPIPHGGLAHLGQQSLSVAQHADLIHKIATAIAHVPLVHAVIADPYGPEATALMEAYEPLDFRALGRAAYKELEERALVGKHDLPGEPFTGPHGWFNVTRHPRGRAGRFIDVSGGGRVNLDKLDHLRAISARHEPPRWTPDTSAERRMKQRGESSPWAEMGRHALRAPQTHGPHAPGQYAPQAPYEDRYAAAQRNAAQFGTDPSWYGIDEPMTAGPGYFHVPASMSDAQLSHALATEKDWDKRNHLDREAIGRGMRTPGPLGPIMSEEEALHRQALISRHGSKARAMGKEPQTHGPFTPFLHSPGRGDAGNLRNFKAMGHEKLTGVIWDLKVYGKDPEALDAAIEAGHAKGISVPDPPGYHAPSVSTPAAPAAPAPSEDETFDALVKSVDVGKHTLPHSPANGGPPTAPLGPEYDPGTPPETPAPPKRDYTKLTLQALKDFADEGDPEAAAELQDRHANDSGTREIHGLAEVPHELIAKAGSYDDPGTASTGPLVGSFVGKRVVVTGKIEGFTRDEIVAKVEDHGGHVVPIDRAKAPDLVVAGEKAGSKLRKAVDRKIPVMPAEEALKLLESDWTGAEVTFAEWEDVDVLLEALEEEGELDG